MVAGSVWERASGSERQRTESYAAGEVPLVAQRRHERPSCYPNGISSRLAMSRQHPRKRGANPIANHQRVSLVREFLIRRRR